LPQVKHLTGMIMVAAAAHDDARSPLCVLKEESSGDAAAVSFLFWRALRARCQLTAGCQNGQCRKRAPPRGGRARALLDTLLLFF
jgi:hypothetical protein